MKQAFLLCAIICSIGIQAQRSKLEKIEFNYIQYPTLRINKQWTYQPKVEQLNKYEILEETKAYLENLEQINDEYLAQIDAYENYSAAEKIIAGKPRKPRLPEPLYERLVLDETVVANEHIQIDGFNKASGNADFVAEILLSGFEIETKFEKNKDNVVFFYDIMYKNPVSIKIYDKNGKVLLNQVVENTTMRKETSKKDSSAELKKYWKENEFAFTKELEKTSYERVISKAAEHINNSLGYVERSESIQINTAKGKKVSYPKLDEAVEIMQRGLVSFSDGSNQGSLDKLKNATELWENVLLDKNIKDKKARVNKKVAAGIHWNCVLTYSILNDFEKAAYHLDELKLIGRGVSGTNAEKFMKNFQERQRL